MQRMKTLCLCVFCCGEKALSLALIMSNASTPKDGAYGKLMIIINTKFQDETHLSLSLADPPPSGADSLLEPFR